MDLTCNEPSVAQKQMEEQNKKDADDLRYLKEVELYFTMKEHIDILNRNACIPHFKLKVIASVYQTTKENLIIVFYVANKWRNKFCRWLSKMH